MITIHETTTTIHTRQLKTIHTRQLQQNTQDYNNTQKTTTTIQTKDNYNNTHKTTTIHSRQLTTIHTKHLKIQYVRKINNTTVRQFCTYSV